MFNNKNYEGEYFEIRSNFTKDSNKVISNKKFDNNDIYDKIAHYINNKNSEASTNSHIENDSE